MPSPGSATPPTDSSAMTGMAGMDHSKMASMDQSKMPGMDMSGIDHSKMKGVPGMQHGNSAMGGMAGMNMGGNVPPGGLWSGLTAPTGTAPTGEESGMTEMAGMQHGAAAPATGSMGDSATKNMPGGPLLAPAPNRNSDLGQVRPSATLLPDAQDTPSPLAVSEAEKAAAPMSMEGMSGMRGQQPGPNLTAQPPSPPEAKSTGDGTHHHGASTSQRAAPATNAPKSDQALYVCPMHPNDTSTHPGTSKCGMPMVRKNKK